MVSHWISVSKIPGCTVCGCRFLGPCAAGLGICVVGCASASGVVVWGTMLEPNTLFWHCTFKTLPYQVCAGVRRVRRRKGAWGATPEPHNSTNNPPTTTIEKQATWARLVGVVTEQL